MGGGGVAARKWMLTLYRADLVIHFARSGTASLGPFNSPVCISFTRSLFLTEGLWPPWRWKAFDRACFLTVELQRTQCIANPGARCVAAPSWKGRMIKRFRLLDELGEGRWAGSLLPRIRSSSATSR